MKKISLLLIFLFIMVGNIYTKSKWSILIGTNYSAFINRDVQSKPGLAFGIRREWRIIKDFSIVSEFYYSERSVLLSNKTITDEFDIDVIYMYDIYFGVGFFELPIIIKYSIPFNRNFQFYINVGPSFSIAFADKSKLKHTHRLLKWEMDEDEWANIKRDYEWTVEPGWFFTNNSGFNLNIGIGVHWSFLSLECRYSRDLHEIVYSQSFYLHEKLHSIYFLLAVRL